MCVADVVVVDAFEEMALLPKEALPFIKRIIHVREKPRKSLFPCAYLDDDDCLSSIRKDIDEHGVKEPKFLSLLDGEEDRFSVGYARVSGSDQKADLARQKAFLSPHCDDVIGDVGSGLNCNNRA